MKYINEFRYRFREKSTGKTFCFNTWCYGSIQEQIDMYIKDLSKMRLVGVSNATHEIIEVTWLYNNKTIYSKEN